MQIIRELRRSIVITVNESGEVVVKAPLFVSMSEITRFVDSKQSWIERQQRNNLQKQSKMEQFDFKNNVYINGEAYNFEKLKENDKRLTKSSFYGRKFEEIILQKAKEFPQSKGVIFKLCNSKCIWGSCNAKSVIKFNWKLVILPEKLQNYVIIHELCHLKEMNHSKDFWREVEKLDQNYKEHRKELKEFSFLLKAPVLE